MGMKTDNPEYMKIINRPDPNEAFPNPKIPSLCLIKNVVKNPNIIVCDYTYYDDVDGADQFEKHVTHFYPFIGDKLIIGKFCAIARGVEFVMNGANHRMDCVTTYPFYIMGCDWGTAIAPVKEELPLKGDTVIGNDVCSLSRLQGIFPTQESNQGLLHCRQILYQLSYQRHIGHS